LERPEQLPVIVGLAVGLGFILLIGIATYFPVTFSMNDTAPGALPDTIKTVKSTSYELQQRYPVLIDGEEFLDRQKQSEVREPIPFSTNIPILQANQMRNELSFTELSHSDQNFRGYYLVVEVIDTDNQDANIGAGAQKKLYVISLVYFKPL
jgi:hypothetical protein